MTDQTVEEFDVDENHEKDRERQERMTKDRKARSRRALIKGKKARQHEGGFSGNI